MEQHSGSTPNATLSGPSALAIVYAVVACLALWLFVLVPGQVGQPVTLFGAAREGLAPDVLPRLVLLGIALIAANGAWRTWRATEARPALPGLPVVVTCAASFAFAALLVPLGFVVASAATVGAVALYLGGRNPVALACAGIAVPVAIYLIFTRVLHISLPQGLAGF